MKIVLIDNQTIAIGPIDLFCCELIRQIRISAEPGGDAAARERLFPGPTAGGDDSAEEDWREYVHPELERLFASHLDIIERDLDGFPEETVPTATEEEGGVSFVSDEHILRIPLIHLDAWIHGLNQARLAIAARHNFTEKDMDEDIPLEGDGRALALFQIHFYGVLQECFLRILGTE
jgi:hypothetical protein